MKRNKRGKGIKKRCRRCKHIVGGGGDIHEKDTCPSPRKEGETERARRRRLRKKRDKGNNLPLRGVVVGGGVGKHRPASSKPGK